MARLRILMLNLLIIVYNDLLIGVGWVFLVGCMLYVNMGCTEREIIGRWREISRYIVMSRAKSFV